MPLNVWKRRLSGSSEGLTKATIYTELVPVVMQKVKAIVCLGKENRKIIETFRDKVATIVETTSMEEL